MNKKTIDNGFCPELQKRKGLGDMNAIYTAVFPLPEDHSRYCEQCEGDSLKCDCDGLNI